MQHLLHLNAQSLLLLAILFLLAGFALRYYIRKNRKGPSCGCGCSGCALSDACSKKIS